MVDPKFRQGGSPVVSPRFLKFGLAAVCLAGVLGVPDAAHAQQERQEASGDEVAEERAAGSDRAGSAESWPVEITLGAGLQYDDQVTVDELDQTLKVGDAAATLDLDLGFEKRFGQGTDLDLGYSLAQKSYFDLSEFDLQIHNLSVDLKQNFENFDVGLRSYAVHARLANEGLLDFQHFSPYFTTFVTDRAYLRTSYFFRNKEFPDNPDRDGDVHAADADVYYFLDGTRNYFVVGVRFEREDTRAPEFDFDGHRLEARWSRRLDLYGDRPVRVRLDWRIERRDYASVTPSIGERRDEDRQRWRLRLDLPVSRRLTGLVTYQHRAHDSNLPAADYDDNRIEAQLEMAF